MSEGARAMFKLAIRFREGRGVKKDAIKAVDWLARAAIKGHTFSKVFGIVAFSGDHTRPLTSENFCKGCQRRISSWECATFRARACLLTTASVCAFDHARVCVCVCVCVC